MSTEVTIEDRVAYAVKQGTRWADNLDANAYDAEHRAKDPERARHLRARETDIRDLLAILTGEKDSYLAYLKNRKES